MLSKSLLKRTEDILNRGITNNVILALLLAIEEEERLITSCISSSNNCSERGIIARDYLAGRKNDTR